MFKRVSAVFAAFCLVLAVPAQALAASGSGDYTTVVDLSGLNKAVYFYCGTDFFNKHITTEFTVDPALTSYGLYYYSSSTVYYPSFYIDGVSRSLMYSSTDNWWNFGATDTYPYSTSQYYFYSGDVLCYAGYAWSISIPPCYSSSATTTLPMYKIYYTSTGRYYGSNGSYLRISLIGVNNTIVSSDILAWSSSSQTITFSGSDITEDVYKISIELSCNMTTSSYVSGTCLAALTSYALLPSEGVGIVFSHEDDTTTYQEEVVGFLGSILSAITSLPDLLLTGIQNLFVPDDTAITSLNAEMTDLLAEKLGAVYTVGDSVTDIFSALTSTDETSTLTFPAISLASVGIDFSIGPYEVSLFPEGFEFLQDYVRFALTIVLILAWINGLLHTFEVIIGGDTSDDSGSDG